MTVHFIGTFIYDNLSILINKHFK
uniref:Uncharacterized protein n=1 Tax=Anguilla anguilla TaxID=7936 RepID=A0A0E9V426_ANGAN